MTITRTGTSHRNRRPWRGGERTAIVVTPALKYGSWSWFDDVIRHSPDISWMVVGYGHRPPGAPANVRFVALPGGDYVKVGRLAAHPWLLWLNFAYVLPLVVIAALLAWWRKPEIVAGNGIAAAGLLPLCRLGSRRTRVWLAYHGAIGHLSGGTRRAIRILLAPVTGAVCNSIGNEKELRAVMPGRSVVPVAHWADDIFFSDDVRERKLSLPLQVLYVGRTDPEKFGQCLRVCTGLAEQGLVELTVAGPPADGPAPPGVRYIGYLSSRSALKDQYSRADVTWAPADVDYLSRPGVEALASGCPVIVSDVPAVGGKCDGSIRIPRDLVPEAVGAVIDGTEDREALALLRRWATGAGTPGNRSACRTFASARFSSRNIGRITDAWFRGGGYPISAGSGSRDPMDGAKSPLASP